MKYCGDCGAENEDRASYCQKCGNNLNVSNKQKKNSISLASIKWLLVLPIAFAIGLMGMASMGPNLLLIIILSLVGVGYLVKEPKPGALNGAITGIISFSIGALSKSLQNEGFIVFVSIIVFAISGLLFGVIFGALGGYIKKNM